MYVCMYKINKITEIRPLETLDECSTLCLLEPLNASFKLFGSSKFELSRQFIV